MYVVSKPRQIALYFFYGAGINDEAADIISVLTNQILKTLLELRSHTFHELCENQYPIFSKQELQSSSRRTRFAKSGRIPAARLWSLFCGVIMMSKLTRVFLKVDALDECKKDRQPDLIRCFAHASTNVRILVSSGSN